MKKKINIILLIVIAVVLLSGVIHASVAAGSFNAQIKDEREELADYKHEYRNNKPDGYQDAVKMYQRNISNLHSQAYQAFMATFFGVYGVLIALIGISLAILNRDSIKEAAEKKKPNKDQGRQGDKPEASASVTGQNYASSEAWTEPAGDVSKAEDTAKTE